MTPSAQPPGRTFRLSVLGSVTLRFSDDGLTTSRLTQPKHLALLSYLVLARPRGLHARETLMALLWPGHDDARARQALRNALYSIRRILGHEAIVTAGEGLIGVNPACADSDALALERGVLVSSEGEASLPFSGFHVDGAPAFDQWMSVEQERLRGLLRKAGTARHAPSAALESTEGRARSPRVHRQDAYALYGRGHYLFLRAAPGGSVDDLLRSREYFERALTLDSTFAPALAGLANFYAVAARREVIGPFREVFARAIDYSRRAEALDDRLAIPHVHYGVEALYLKEDFDAAGRAFASAAEREPEYAEAHRFYGVWLGMTGRHLDALAQMEIAAQLEPDIPHMLSSLAAARLISGDVSGGEAVLRRTLGIDPLHGPSRDRLLRVLEDHGRLDEAMALRRTLPSAKDLSEYEQAWSADGATGYLRVRDAGWRQEAALLEARLAERAEPTTAEIFAPPIVRLVALWVRLGELRRAHGWKLQACAERPLLSRWFAALPEASRL